MLKYKGKFFIAVIIFILTVPIFCSADVDTKTLQISNIIIKIIYNNQEVRGEKSPIVSDGVTYIPLRMMADLFDRTVEWDERNKSIIIFDKNNESINKLKEEIVKKDKKISELEVKLSRYEGKNSKVKSIGSGLDYLEGLINDDYDSYEEMKFNVFLSGDSEEVRVKIDIDLKEYSKEWSKLSNSKKEEYVEEIVDLIASEYDDSKIRGYIKDSNKGTILLNFYKNSNSKMKTGTGSYSDTGSLEKRLNNAFDRTWGNMYMTYKLDGDEDSLCYYIYLDYEDYSKWKALSDSTVKNHMSNIYSEIKKTFSDCDISGYIYDLAGTTLAEYSKSSSSKFEFERYED